MDSDAGVQLGLEIRLQFTLSFLIATKVFLRHPAAIPACHRHLMCEVTVRCQSRSMKEDGLYRIGSAHRFHAWIKHLGETDLSHFPNP